MECNFGGGSLFQGVPWSPWYDLRIEGMNIYKAYEPEDIDICMHFSTIYFSRLIFIYSCFYLYYDNMFC